ncbi:UDP-N-acetyl-D-glucosamine 6-dehydrogenase [Planctomycetes bacterium Poly30]|uniref:UDP-N-acetyl-D-glucosamine 6-dehydrogenase n=1 Tax=Saltatorellus ferox TaxID=2528018 RepID=A0A518EVJ4_9BACT|nr:UDP-N-acetyl-D-glucosamine 6-dehydrogenase [Planctomycetes bacterium Poly30]
MNSNSQPVAKVGIVGLGAVGLPLAALFGQVGLELVLVDSSVERVEQIRRGESPLAHLPAGLIDRLGNALISTSPEALDGCDAIVICVPTPLRPDRTPDLSAVRSAAREAATFVRAGGLVVLESTTWPGTTRHVLGKIFEFREDVDLAYSPERVDPGRVDASRAGGDLLGAGVPKLVGGVTKAATERAAALYRLAFETVIEVGSSDVAEAAKLVENIHRAVNIALVGELKIAFDAMGLDVWEVLDAAATKPFGFTRFDPGPGMGGHCLPIDPFYLSWAAKRAGAETRFVELSGEINRAMPGFVAAKTQSALRSIHVDVDEARVLLVGVAYKRGVGIVEESPAFPIAAALRAEGAQVSYADPLVPSCSLGESLDVNAEALADFDAVVILVDQEGVDLDLIAACQAVVVDTRAALRKQLLGSARYFMA